MPMLRRPDCGIWPCRRRTSRAAKPRKPPPPLLPSSATHSRMTAPNRTGVSRAGAISSGSSSCSCSPGTRGVGSASEKSASAADAARDLSPLPSMLSAPASRGKAKEKPPAVGLALVGPAACGGPRKEEEEARETLREPAALTTPLL